MTQHLVEKCQREARQDFVQRWDTGQFEWNHHDGDVLGKKPVSLERVWNEFVEPLISQIIADTERAERERIWSGICKLADDYTGDLNCHLDDIDKLTRPTPPPQETEVDKK